MKKPVRYWRTTFEPDFLSGVDERGATIRFTRAERLLLIQFTRNPKMVLSRDRLLDAVSGPGSDASDRNIDFIINRLRRKLKDSARDPAYIATQYAEGYVWIAEPVTTVSGLAGAFLVIGPVRGLAHTGAFADRARAYTEALCAALDQQTAKDRKVVIDVAGPSAAELAGDKPHFAAELDFLAHDGRLDCAITLKVFATGQILYVTRRPVSDNPAASGALDREPIKAAAADITAAIWDNLAYPPQAAQAPTELPLAVRMHEAALLLADASARWRQTEQRLRATLARDPDNAQAQIMLASCLHSKYVSAQNCTILPEDDQRAQDEDEMERLLMASLPRLQSNPIFMMTAGKLLYFLDRGHRNLGLEIVENAFSTSTAFASSFAILGQIRMFKGDFENALRLLDQGLELCADGSAFNLYLLVIKCEVLLAAGDSGAMDAVLRLIYEKAPETRTILPAFFPSIMLGENDPDALAIVENINERRARGMLIYANYICARLFDDPAHRANILRPPLTLLVRHFGPSVVSSEILVSAPALLADVRNAQRPLTVTAARHSL